MRARASRLGRVRINGSGCLRASKPLILALALWIFSFGNDNQVVGYSCRVSDVPCFDVLLTCGVCSGLAEPGAQWSCSAPDPSVDQVLYFQVRPVIGAGSSTHQWGLAADEGWDYEAPWPEPKRFLAQVGVPIELHADPNKQIA